MHTATPLSSMFMPQRKGVSWLIAAVLLSIVATFYAIRSETFEIDKIRGSLVFSSPKQPEVGLEKGLQLGPLTCPEHGTKPYLDLPPEYTVTSTEDQLCELFYTEKYIQRIATNSRSLCDEESTITEFAVPTHPHQRKLNKATPVQLLQGVRWNPVTASFEAQCSKKAKKPKVYGTDLTGLTYREDALGCRNSSDRQLIIYPILKEYNFNNIWHKLLELWQNKLSFDAMRIALNPATGEPYVTSELITNATVVFPDTDPGPWGELWEIITGKPALLPDSLAPDVCYDVVVPTVGWASPFWSALLKTTYETCSRQTLMTSFVNQILGFYGVTPRPPSDVGTKDSLAITVIQRTSSRKFQDVEGLMAKLQERHPDANVSLVDLAPLSKREQIALAHSTDVWVGHHGAGMSHVMFLPPGAAVVEIVPPFFVQRGFRWVARMRGVVHFIGRAMWEVEYKEKYDGVPKPDNWKPTQQSDGDADGWQTWEWIWIKHEEVLDLVDAAVLSQKNGRNEKVA